MIPKIIDAKYKKNYIIYLHFSDGTQGEIDLQNELYGEMFEPLKDQKFFKTFSIHPDFHTIYWPNGADIAPEYLYEKIKVPV